MIKETILAISLGLGLCSFAGAQTFDVKVYSNGEPIAEKPGALRDFLEMRNARRFSKAKLPDLHGKLVPINGFKNKMVMVDMWATWCEPCIRALPGIVALQDYFNKDPKSKVKVVSVALDTDVQDIKDFLADEGLKEADFFTLYDPKKKIEEVVPMDVIPSMFVIDGNGNLIGFVRGYIDWEDPEVIPYLEELANKYAVRNDVKKK